MRHVRRDQKNKFDLYPRLGVSDDECDTDDSSASSPEDTDADERPPFETAPIPVAEPVVEPIAEPMAEPVAEPVSEPMVEPMAESVAEPVAESVAEPVAEPVAETKAETEPAVEPVVAEPVSYADVDLEEYEAAQQLEALGLNHLKEELQRRGLKCGGTLTQRAQRLWAVKGLDASQIPAGLLAKPCKTR